MRPKFLESRNWIILFFLQSNTASKYQIEELMNYFLSSNKVLSFFLFHHGFKKIDFASSICHNQVQGSEMKEVIGPQSKSWRQPARPFPAIMGRPRNEST